MRLFEPRAIAQLYPTFRRTAQSQVFEIMHLANRFKRIAEYIGTQPAQSSHPFQRSQAFHEPAVHRKFPHLLRGKALQIQGIAARTEARMKRNHSRKLTESSRLRRRSAERKQQL